MSLADFPKLGEAADFWASWMWPMAVQGAVLILVIGVLDRALRRWLWPQLLQALWLLVLLKHLLPPDLFSPWALSPRLAGRAMPVEAPSSDGLLSTGFPGMGFLGAGSLEGGLLGPCLLALWLLGFAVAAAQGLRRHRRLRRRLLAGAEAPEIPLAAIWARARMRFPARGRLLRRLLRSSGGGPALLVSPQAPGPAVLGLLRPVVILPRSLVVRWQQGDLADDEMEHVLHHELAHLRRGDLWQQALFSFVHWLYWFQPLLPWAMRRAYASRELCCDAAVAASLGERAPDYRRALLRSARLVLERPGWPRPAVAALVAGGGTLDRLRWLEKGSGRSPRLRWLAGVVLLLAASFTLLPMAPEPAAVRKAREEVAAAVAGGSSLQVRYSVMALHALSDEKSRSEEP